MQLNDPVAVADGNQPYSYRGRDSKQRPHARELAQGRDDNGVRRCRSLGLRRLRGRRW